MLYLIPIIVGIVLLVLIIWGIASFFDNKRRKEQLELVKKAFDYIGIKQYEVNNLFKNYNTRTTVKSRQAIEKYDLASFFKEHRDYFSIIKRVLDQKSLIINQIKEFMKSNPFTEEKEYQYLRDYLDRYVRHGSIYIIKVDYITKANNCLATKTFTVNKQKVIGIENRPELYMSKTEMKTVEKERLEAKKRKAYSQVNLIIDKANDLKESLIVKRDSDALDDLITKLFDRTVNSIQKIKQINSDEWGLIDRVITDIENEINKIEKKSIQLREYYQSNEFANLKLSCETLMNSQKEFNSYIDEKIQSISKAFGMRTVRNETEHEDVYNYVRTYNKTISPFVAELSSNVFASAENNPIQYLIKYFYPNRSLYKEQIIELKNLLNELEALKDARVIIENYKKEYQKYFDNVPSYVLEEDEDGFYSRLGFATIDENIFNVAYKFVYTSNGGMAQRSFTVSMTEETISELILQLQEKLSSASISKEQRALVTPKLRLYIKERDKYTCCSCKNSTKKEPNLLLEIDHIVPIAKGGLTVEDNLQTLCWKCNRSKGAKLL